MGHRPTPARRFLSFSAALVGGIMGANRNRTATGPNGVGGDASSILAASICDRIGHKVRDG